MRRAWRGVLKAIAVPLVLVWSGCAPPTLLCRRPEVVQDVNRIVRQWNVYNQVDEAWIRESPTSRADSVICDADMSTIAYDATASGWRPRPVRLPLRFSVQVSGNHFFVQAGP